jgi:hypothetical protein
VPLPAALSIPLASASGTLLPRRDLILVRRDLNAAGNAELARLYDDGTIGQATRQRLRHSLDLEAARLSDDQR